MEEDISLRYGMYDLINPRYPATEVKRGAFVETEEYFTAIGFAAGKENWLSRAMGCAVLRVPGEKRLVRGASANSMHSFSLRADARGRILISIDPLQPLEPQFADIRRELAKSQSHARARTDKYELALRLLDARSTDRQQGIATWKEIESVISNEPFRKTLTKIQLKRKHRHALTLQTKFFKPYYHVPGERFLD